MKNSAIKRIVLEMGGEEIELSVEDAKKLQAALNDLFGHPQQVYIPYVQPYKPYKHPRPYWWGEIWYSSNTSGTGSSGRSLSNGDNIMTCSIGTTSAVKRLT